MNKKQRYNVINSLQFSIENSVVTLKRNNKNQIVFIKKVNKHDGCTIYRANKISDNKWNIEYSKDWYDAFKEYINQKDTRSLKIYNEKTFDNIIDCDIKKTLNQKISNSEIFVKLKNIINLNDNGNEKQNQKNVFNNKITVEKFHNLILQQRNNLICSHCKENLSIESHIIPNFLLQGLQTNNFLYKGYPFDLISSHIKTKTKVLTDFLLPINANNKEAKFPIYCQKCDNDLFASFENHNLFFTDKKKYEKTIELINQRYKDYIFSQITFLRDLKQKIGHSKKYFPLKDKYARNSIFNIENNLKKTADLIIPKHHDWESEKSFYDKKLHITFDIEKFPELSGFSFIPGSKFPFLFNQTNDSGLKRSMWKYAYSICSVFIHKDKSGNKRNIINFSFYNLSISEFSLACSFFTRKKRTDIMFKDTITALFLHYGELYFDFTYINKLDFKNKNGLLDCLALRNNEYSNKYISFDCKLPSSIKMNCLSNKSISSYRSRQIIYQTIFSDLFTEIFLDNTISDLYITSKHLEQLKHINNFFLDTFIESDINQCSISIERTYEISKLYGGQSIEYKIFYLKKENTNLFIAKRYETNTLDTANIVNEEFGNYLMDLYNKKFSMKISKKDLAFFIFSSLLCISQQYNSGPIYKLTSNK